MTFQDQTRHLRHRMAWVLPGVRFRSNRATEVDVIKAPLPGAQSRLPDSPAPEGAGIAAAALRRRRAEKGCFHNRSLPCVVLNARLSDLAADLSESAADPVARLCCALISLPGGCRTVTLSALPRRALLLSAFSKDHPSVALKSPSPLPRRISPSLCRSAAIRSACSDPVVSRHFAGLLLGDLVRTLAAAHNPGVHRRFTPSRSLAIPAMRFLPFEAFPPPIAVCR